MARKAKFVVTLDQASDTEVTVAYTTVAASAVEGEDFTPTSGTLTFAPGEISKNVYVDLREVEETADESFQLVLSTPVGAELQDAVGECLIPGVVDPGDGYGNAFLANFDGVAGTDVADLTLQAPIGTQWRVEYFGDPDLNRVVLNGTGSAVQPGANSYAQLFSDYLGQRDVYIAEVDFTLLTQFDDPGQAWDLYLYFGDGRQYTEFMLDIYAYGGGVEFVTALYEGPRSTSTASTTVDLDPFTGFNPIGEQNKIRLEVYADSWKLLFNGVEVINAAESLGLQDPSLRIEMGNYNPDGTVPYTLDRVRVADTPLRVQVPFLGNYSTLYPVVTLYDTLDGASTVNIEDHAPIVGEKAQAFPAPPSGQTLDGNGGIAPLAGSWSWYFGSQPTSDVIETRFKIRWGAPPRDGWQTQFTLQGPHPIILLYGGDGTLTFQVGNAGAGGMQTLPFPTPGQEVEVLIRENSRSVECYYDGVLMQWYERGGYIESFATAWPGRMYLTIYNPESYTSITLTEYTVTEYQLTAGEAVPTTLLLDTFSDAAGTALSAHTPDTVTSGAWNDTDVPTGVTWMLNGAGQLWLNAKADYGGTFGNATFGPLPTAAEYIVELDAMVRDVAVDGQFNWHLKDANHDIRATFYHSQGDQDLRCSVDGQGSWAGLTPIPAQTNFRLRIEVRADYVKMYRNSTLVFQVAGLALVNPQLLLEYQNYDVGSLDLSQSMQFTRVWVATPVMGLAGTPANESVTPYVPVAPLGGAVVLLLRAADGMIDKSAAAHQLNTPGAWSVVNSAGDLGGSAFQLPGYGGGMVFVDNPTDFVLDGDFTIEFFATKASNGNQGYDIVASTYHTSNAGDGWWIELSASRGFFFGGTATSGGSAGGSTAYLSYATNPNDGVRRHWTLERYQGVLTMYRDGVAVATTSARNGFVFPAAQLEVGSDYYGESFNGKLDQFRITKGRAVYQGAFAPPTTALTA